MNEAFRIGVFMLFLLLVRPSFGQYSHIEDSTVFEENEEPVHANFYVADNRAELDQHYLERDNYILLNG